MENTYLYVFGYQTPLQRKNKTLHGWDDLDSTSFFIRTESKVAAHTWGDALANAFVRTLYRDEAMTLGALGCSGTIEEDMEVIRRCEAAGTPVVSVGDQPDMEALIEKKYGKESWWQEQRGEKKSNQ